MPDFYQHRAVTTLHLLGERRFDEQRHRELVGYARARPLTLVMPALYSEVEGEALPEIVGQLAGVDFVDEVVISMNNMDAPGFARAKRLFAALPQRHAVIWNDGPGIQEVYRELGAAGIATYRPGKGCSVWMAFGYAIARGRSAAIVLHDSDILSYEHEMLARLCLPVLHPEMHYDFCKSYYGRVNGRMFGRVTRLFVIPLLRALRDVCGDLPLLGFLDEFRYPLSGEFTLSTDLARRLPMASDWGLEVGMLAEVFRAAPVERVCQVALGANFDHKHQTLGSPLEASAADGEGLHSMAADIAASLLAESVAAGANLDAATLGQLLEAYRTTASDLIRRYRDDSIANGLSYSSAEEVAAVGVFAEVLAGSGARLLGGGQPQARLPPWDEVLDSAPGIASALLAAVDADNS